jgi:hypothetical protein
VQFVKINQSQENLGGEPRKHSGEEWEKVFRRIIPLPIIPLTPFRFVFFHFHHLLGRGWPRCDSARNSAFLASVKTNGKSCKKIAKFFLHSVAPFGTICSVGGYFGVCGNPRGTMDLKGKSRALEQM